MGKIKAKKRREEMVKKAIECPYCGSEDIVKHGKSTNGVQVYRCRNKNYEKSRFPLEYRNKGVLRGHN